MTTRTQNLPHNRSRYRSQIVDRLSRQIQCWFEMKQLKISLRQERKQLMTMSDELLKDLGISRADAETEARRKDIPPSRLETLRHC